MTENKSNDTPKSPHRGTGGRPSLPQGTRDFGPEVVRKRQYILHTIKAVFELYGFQPLETPAMEKLETLTGKYGEEGDKLIFRILDSGNPFDESFFDSLWKYMEDFDNEVKKNQLSAGQEIIGFWENLSAISAKNFITDFALELKENRSLSEKYSPRLKKVLTEKALRYDLTIPFARYVAMNHGQLVFPFKRYQIQPVWRADRPQKGRYREFYQCDADVVGSKALINEVEFINIYKAVFEKLKIPVEIKINSRKMLTALAELCGGADKMMDITIAIDKLDKIGLPKVAEELQARGLTEEQINSITAYLQIADSAGDNNAVIEGLKALFKDNTVANEGLSDLGYILERVQDVDSTVKVNIDPALARGLNYYTGTIFEIKAVGVAIGSIGGGGRYDDLTGLFGVPGIPGAGISFGVDRMYDVLEELRLFPEAVEGGTKALFFNLGEAESRAAYMLLQSLRAKAIAAEIFHEVAKFDKQFKYAEKKGIPYIIIIGSQEVEQQECTIKDLRNGRQQKVSFTDLPFFSFI